jgi:hypothetical protein
VATLASIITKERFDDIGSEDTDGYVEYEYHGFNYQVMVRNRVFIVRTYDDKPGIAIVISPTNARTCPESFELVEFIETGLGCSRIKFYFGATGMYCFVNASTLEFET